MRGVTVVPPVTFVPHPPGGSHMRHLILLAVLVPLAYPLTAVGDDTIYRWQDAASGIHYSNRSEVVPDHATPVELPPLPSHHAPVPRIAPPSRVPSPPRASLCPAPDPAGVIE